MIGPRYSLSRYGGDGRPPILERTDLCDHDVVLNLLRPYRDAVPWRDLAAGQETMCLSGMGTRYVVARLPDAVADASLITRLNALLRMSREQGHGLPIIAAIKEAREVLGLSLVDAKRFVEAHCDPSLFDRMNEGPRERAVRHAAQILRSCDRADEAYALLRSFNLH